MTREYLARPNLLIAIFKIQATIALENIVKKNAFGKVDSMLLNMQSITLFSFHIKMHFTFKSSLEKKSIHYNTLALD